MHALSLLHLVRQNASKVVWLDRKLLQHPFQLYRHWLFVECLLIWFPWLRFQYENSPLYKTRNYALNMKHHVETGTTAWSMKDLKVHSSFRRTCVHTTCRKILMWTLPLWSTSSCQNKLLYDNKIVVKISCIVPNSTLVPVPIFSTEK